MRFRSIAVLAAVLVAVSMATVPAQPVPSVSPTFIDFGTIPASSMLTQSFWVHNSGDTTLLSLISSTDVVRFDPQPTFIQVAAGDSAEIDVTFDPFNFGEHSATIIVRSLQSAQPESLFVDVTGIGGPEAPVLGVSPSSFNVIMAEDDVEVHNLRITNNGGGTLDWFITEEPAPGATWLSQLPDAGSLSTLAYDDVNVTFDTEFLTPGVYSTTIRVNSIAGDTDVPVTLLIEGTPNISISATSLDFGRVYHGFSLDRKFTVFNTGTAVLFVDTLRITGSTDYTVAPMNAVLQPGQWVEATVTLTPTVDGPITGNARVESNDPDQPFVNVALTGDGSSLSPPVISALPDTISISLFTGQIESRDVVVANSGGDSLLWTASAEAANPNPLDGLSILIDHSHGLSAFFTESNTVFASLVNAGATVIPNYAPVTLPLLLNHDVLFIPSPTSVSRWQPDEIAAARDFVLAQRGILVEATNSRGYQNANALSDALGAGMTTGYQWGAGDVLTSYIYTSPITAGVDLLALEHWSAITSLSAPAQLLVNYDAVLARRHSGTAELGGRLMISTDEFHQDDLVTQPGVDNLGFALQAFEWLGSAPSVTLDKTAGATAVGESDTIRVTLDATTLPAGSYPARVVINSNDPVNQSVSVAVIANVTGTAIIEVSDTSLAFNNRYVGVPQQIPVTITNQGLEPLNISDIALSDPSFMWTTSAGAPPFAIATTEAETLHVTFNPVSTGPHAASLAIASNAFNADTVSIALTGTGIDPVALSAVPDSIHVTMVPDDSTSVPLAIHNAASQGEAVRMAFNETLGGAETNVLFDNFEDANLDGWSIADSAGTTEVVGTGGGNSSLFAYRESGARAGHHTGIYRLLPAVQPRAMSFWVRPDRDDEFTNYVTLRDGEALRREVIYFFATASGTFYINANVGGNQSYTYTAGQWYHIEYRDIDWVGKHFDYVVNDSLVQADVPMRNSADVTEVSRLDLYHFEAGGAGEFDDIWIDSTSPPDWLHIAPDVATVPGGGSAPFPLALSTTGITDGTFTALTSFASNDPHTPLLTVPVVLLVDSTVTGTGTPLPRQTALLQNVPNPFNPTTTIRFELATPADIRLEIYSVRGARIRTLASGRHPAGSHTIQWDGRSDRGAQVASGVYFYRLVAGRFAQTRKMVLLK